MKAKSRKHLLISSIAMLLVAAVALGAATYAWFTQSPKANAQGLEVKATASNGLKILSETHAVAASKSISDPSTFVTTTYLNADTASSSSTTPFNLTPASVDVSTTDMNAYTTSAASADNAAADTSAQVTNATKGHTGTEMIYSERIYCALIGAANATDTTTISIDALTVTQPDTKMKEALRVALVYYDGTSSTVVGAYAPSTKTDSTILTGIADTYGEVSTSEYTFQPFASAAKEVGTLTTTGNCYFEVLVYIDGEDSTAYSSNIQASELITSINLELSIPTT